MKKTKTFISLLFLATCLSVSPAFAVVEPIKVLQYSLRNVQATIEVVKNAISLGLSVQQTALQGTIGAIAPVVKDLKSKMDLESFAPTLPADLQNVVSGNGFQAIPHVKTYVENELKSIRLGDGITQRDVLNKINELQSKASLDAIQIAKETLAKSNKGPEENKAQLDNVAKAPTSQSKASQETAQSIQTLKNDVVRNQLTSNLLLIKATKYKNDLLKATQRAEDIVDEGANAAEKLADDIQKKISDAVNQVADETVGAGIAVVKDAAQPITNAVADVQNTAKQVGQDVNGISDQISSVAGRG